MVAPKLHVVLDRPRIAGNVGAVVRLVAATGCALHICGPLPFAGDDRGMWRAGLDYWAGARVHFHLTLARCLALLGPIPWIVEAGGTRAPWEVELLHGDIIVLGPEDGSVEEGLTREHPTRVLTLPTEAPARSLNVAQCAAAVVFEARRQQLSRSAPRE